MNKALFNRQALTDLSWWHWAATVPLLVARLAGYSGALVASMVLCAAVGGYFFVRLRQVRPFPVQVRLVYLGLLAVGAMPWMAWIHWVQLFGTTAMIAVGYCPLARILSLLPLNRSEPLSRAIVWRVFVQDPCAGGLMQWGDTPLPSAGACCSLRSLTATSACSLQAPASATSTGARRQSCRPDRTATESFGALAHVQAE